MHHSDRSYFERIFDGCSKLDSVTLAVGYGTRGGSKMPQLAFAETLTSPFGDTSLEAQGVGQLNALAYGLYYGRRPLRDLTLSEISPRAFYPVPRADSIKQHLMESLHRFRLSVGTFIVKDDGEEAERVLDETAGVVQARNLHAYIRAATGLQELKLHFATGEHLEPRVPFDAIFEETTWSKLRKLQLSHVTAGDRKLVEMLFRHKDTLEILDLNYMELYDGSWESVFKEIAGKLPCLRRVRLRGSLVDEDGIGEFNFHPVMFWARRDAIETVILKGGEWPDLKAMSDVERYPWDVPNYAEPELERDDDGCPSDDSAESTNRTSLSACK